MRLRGLSSPETSRRGNTFGMVGMALDKLAEQGVVELDEERKASMVSNLLVVLCSDSRTTPVVNTGSLYS